MLSLEKDLSCLYYGYVSLFVNYRLDGRVFDGMWKNGLQHGEGTYTNAEGKVRKGVWKEGTRVKSGDRH